MIRKRMTGVDGSPYSTPKDRVSTCASTHHSSSYKTKLEAAFAQRLEIERRTGLIAGWLYEPFSFRLATGKRYRVDFVSWVQSDEGFPIYLITCYETKGWHKNIRDSLTHLKWAAQRFPFYQWRKVVSNGKGGFEIMEVKI